MHFFIIDSNNAKLIDTYFCKISNLVKGLVVIVLIMSLLYVIDYVFIIILLS